MAFEDDFDELDKMLAAKSTDYDKMRAALKKIRGTCELARMMGPALDRIYASIARGHRKVLINLEAGDIAAAKREAAKVMGWFYLRFNGFETGPAASRIAQVTEELLKVRELAKSSEILRNAIGKITGQELHEP